MSRFLHYFTVGLKGIGMGAADVIPGVSGGTIAFLTGIYQELIDSIKSVDLQALKLLFTGKIAAFWKKINGTFLFSLIAGIIISFLSLARLMTYLMEHEPIALWSFFLGLIIASAIYILKDIRQWNIIRGLSLAAGIALGAVICLISPSQTPTDLWFIFLCGMIAICAMILPGISGSFILLLLGKYEYMLQAIAELDIPVILVFVVGAAIGIVSFSHFLSWLLKKYHTETICFLAGIMIGSLLKVWPWQNALPSGISRPMLPEPVAESQIGIAVLFTIIGIALIFVIEGLAKRLQKKGAGQKAA